MHRTILCDIRDLFTSFAAKISHAQPMPQCIATLPMVHSKNMCFILTSSCVETYSFASYKSKQFVFVSHVVLNKTNHFAVSFGQYSSTVETCLFARQNITYQTVLKPLISAACAWFWMLSRQQSKRKWKILSEVYKMGRIGVGPSAEFSVSQMHTTDTLNTCILEPPESEGVAQIPFP